MLQLSAASTILAGTLLVAAAVIGGSVGWAISNQQQNQLDPTQLDPQGKRQLTLDHRQIGCSGQAVQKASWRKI